MTDKKIINWIDLHAAFMNICRADADCSKSSDGYMRLDFLPTNYWNDEGDKVKPFIMIEFGGYQIGDWNRHQQFGPFLTEIEAWEEGVKRVREAYDIVNKNMLEDGKRILMYPSILL